VVISKLPLCHSTERQASQDRALNNDPPLLGWNQNRQPCRSLELSTNFYILISIAAYLQ
jgi:hypothetical protein